jgi:DNA-binding CsgD family transcriptional regulator
MNAVDPVSVLEVSYASHPDERSWLSEVARALRPLVDADGMSLHAYVARGMRQREHDLLFFGRYPKERLLRTLAEDLAYPPVSPQATKHLVEKVATSHGMASLRQLAGGNVSEFWGHGVHDSVAFICADGQGEAVVVAALRERALQLSRSEHALWQRVAAHVGAARRLVGGGHGFDDERVECVMTPARKVVDARGCAKTEVARERLREAARAVDRARTRRGRADPQAALTAWAGLFAGRWSLVDRFDSDGRRFIVAQRNDPSSPIPGALTRRQRQVAFYACMGWSNKEIAYALGLKPTTVSMHLQRALSRLGLESRLALVQMGQRIAVATFEQGGRDGDEESDGPARPL